MGPMGWLAWVMIGGFSGALVGVVLHKWSATIEHIMLGAIGALAGGYVFTLVGIPGTSSFYIWSIFTAFLGALILIAMIRLVDGTEHYRHQPDRSSRKLAMPVTIQPL